ncbi:hypothetical protein PHYBLDRAFT_176301 [Phycomyces blakesleeanus NRRL 1555(-)]|uniref:Uncharacterized protein n=1 Tax=Phycomyces blakesleeanus (strain ATCC 8743b / DSM 1359 / FGSC 10004 / NBRC 33097 / NRRL 1555) TaxID=763407 RepID=A0A162N2S7_PHYB8|nr:hypothetical protein PHYBLDRAFT_176301 [Phycomyces blakesleeanus NRRL 1555(-)]OAD65254.1 hypothetical protein PHYBLDRAFT_176301 [Phycomyces blakesleeanus NRRL 1555(-)]|eukprot:XP_018283294.1 hypothetical protein PHYBLDRAFT_176301 [Phycomyces blakesleeanus NRRL 1555(-)]
MTDAATHFYEKQYSVDPINDSPVEDLLSHVPSNQFFSEATRSSMTFSLAFDGICAAVGRSPHYSSPGPDSRATVLNTLILSRIWHALRIKTVLKRFFDELCSILGRFLRRNMLSMAILSSMFSETAKRLRRVGLADSTESTDYAIATTDS